MAGRRAGNPGRKPPGRNISARKNTTKGSQKNKRRDSRIPLVCKHCGDSRIYVVSKAERGRRGDIKCQTCGKKFRPDWGQV